MTDDACRKAFEAAYERQLGVEWDTQREKDIMWCSWQASRTDTLTLLQSDGFINAVRDSIRENSGGHALTNMIGNRLWYPDQPVNLTEIVSAIISFIKGDASKEGSTKPELSGAATCTTSPTNYAGGQPERHNEEVSATQSSTPDRQGDALIAEPPAPVYYSPVYEMRDGYMTQPRITDKTDQGVE